MATTPRAAAAAAHVSRYFIAFLLELASLADAAWRVNASP
jgi:hypothetical protein